MYWSTKRCTLLSTSFFFGSADSVSPRYQQQSCNPFLVFSLHLSRVSLTTCLSCIMSCPLGCVLDSPLPYILPCCVFLSRTIAMIIICRIVTCHGSCITCLRDQPQHSFPHYLSRTMSTHSRLSFRLPPHHRAASTLYLWLGFLSPPVHFRL